MDKYSVDEVDLHKTLTKFVIGAMQLDDMMRYIDAGSLINCRESD